MHDYDRRAGKYDRWDRKQRDRELGRLMDYLMDMEADGVEPPLKIRRIVDRNRRPTEAEENILLEWSESNTPGHY